MDYSKKRCDVAYIHIRKKSDGTEYNGPCGRRDCPNCGPKKLNKFIERCSEAFDCRANLWILSIDNDITRHWKNFRGILTWNEFNIENFAWLKIYDLDRHIYQMYIFTDSMEDPEIISDLWRFTTECRGKFYYYLDINIIDKIDSIYDYMRDSLILIERNGKHHGFSKSISDKITDIELGMSKPDRLRRGNLKSEKNNDYEVIKYRHSSFDSKEQVMIIDYTTTLSDGSPFVGTEARKVIKEIGIDGKIYEIRTHTIEIFDDNNKKEYIEKKKILGERI